MKVDIIKTSKEDFELALNELTKDELIKLMVGLKKELEEEFESFTFEFTNIPFERIRRITGYLVGTLDRFNNGKKEEEKARVKHNVQQD
jgi:hypothetical protein